MPLLKNASDRELRSKLNSILIMKKVLFLLALLPLFALIGCSSDDENNSKPEQELIGSWVEVTKNEFEEKRHLTFRADMTGNIYISVGERIDWERDFTWEVADNIIKVTYTSGGVESGTYELGTYEVDGDTLIMNDGRFVYTRQ